MSGQIERERKEYYTILEQTQKGGLNISRWLNWFLACLGRAIDGSEQLLAAVLRKAHIWQQASAFPLNERQRTMLNRLLDNFEGKLTSSKYAKLAKCSPDTALRDIQALIAFGILKQAEGGGRSTSYVLRVDE